ncbi:hypothetical protein PAB09_09185 [Corynebacterium sp. SCR221107]|uniref:hypothetical protein n=1 Tax=Corynebacterium sp. SCR221107 TaxID=3017361 RepID=UPI0022EC924B|nr:hypothetical protein [Corynebacterium sp. SCR221107]WBT08072.1 hypothetical protein PAB09_09185 [Corynebacterium sp. SCR221107]
MAVHISLDLDNCTFGQLLAFVDAVESAGAHRSTQGRVEGSTLHFSIDEAQSGSGAAGVGTAGSAVSSAVSHAASAAASNLAHVDTAKLGDAVMGAFIDAFNNKRR